MFSEIFIKRVFLASSMQRWNDHIRPVELTEIDKRGHQAIIAYIIGKYEEQKGNSFDWKKLIEGLIFEFIFRLVLTDIHPKVFHKIIKEKRKETNEWVIKELEPVLESMGDEFKFNFIRYIEDENYSKLEKEILDAASFFSTKYEFDLVYESNKNTTLNIENTKKEIYSRLEEYKEKSMTKEILKNQKILDFIKLCSQLRFQQRWAQAPRIPKTSVLGHMYFVALISYMCSVEIEASPKRLFNNFFTSLFHDLPEVLTRDIISPVKQGIEGLSELIKEYEKSQMEEIVYPLLPEFIRKDIEYFTENEFASRIKINDETIITTSENIQNKFNKDEFSPVDGEILKACDHLGAYMEAVSSKKHGIKAIEFDEGIERFLDIYKDKEILGINFGKIFDLLGEEK
ncbi:MAG: HD domain-containing protein [Candidatus Gracilibacteria bacterium]|nr:HD domain-containing protein [Candidatus Gracilibacteria bacterium]MDD3120072.1 HD domain-containing protein [Candidatus Gracilibacteria bacterium]MDD4530290.1 HD domain-containing protein [Candidatus Gracilibacteria bacterium]